MACRVVATLALAVAVAGLAGTGPKTSAADYPVHSTAGKVALGAEYMVRSFHGSNQTFVADRYLVVEVAVFPPKFEKLTLSAGQFTLRVNGKKRALLPQPPSFVGASLKYPDWERRPTVIAGGGVGDRGVIFGPPPVTGRFPGDPRPQVGRLPAPPKAPRPDNPAGIETAEPVRAEDVVVETALPEGEISGPVSGYLYFPYKKKTKSIRSLELIYLGPAGEATLKLF